MSTNPWHQLDDNQISGEPQDWLTGVLARNRHTAYLSRLGAPQTMDEYRDRVPVCRYDELHPWLERIQAGEANILFAGRPVAYERTGGSSGGAKLIPYTREGLQDFQRDIVPWLARTAREHDLCGKAYFAISPATRQPEFIQGIPVGLPDAAYLGEQAGQVLCSVSAVPLETAIQPDVTIWRQQTLTALRAAHDLELISVWSPTFLLRLLEEVPDPEACWPRLKVISCWASGSAARFAEALRTRLPHAVLQPKGLLSTEAVITVPGEGDQPVPARHVFLEYEAEGVLRLERELTPGQDYGIVVTTASGLYRYRTDDRVRCMGHNARGQPILEFVGREGLTCDLAGEKLTEPFVSRCLHQLSRHAMLIPDAERPGYVLVCENDRDADLLPHLEAALRDNPQYAYARDLEQLAPLRALKHPDPFAVVERCLLARGVRLGDVKPLALRRETSWLPLFESGRS